MMNVRLCKRVGHVLPLTRSCLFQRPWPYFNVTTASNNWNWKQYLSVIFFFFTWLFKFNICTRPWPENADAYSREITDLSAFSIDFLLTSEGRHYFNNWILHTPFFFVDVATDTWRRTFQCSQTCHHRLMQMHEGKHKDKNKQIN